MTLLELIPFLKESNKIEELINKEYPELDIDYADIYLLKDFDIPKSF